MKAPVAILAAIYLLRLGSCLFGLVGGFDNVPPSTQRARSFGSLLAIATTVGLLTWAGFWK